MLDSFEILGPYQCTLADTCHGCDLAISFSLLQQGQGQLKLLWGKLFWTSFPEIGILARNRFPSLGALHDHTPLIFCKGQHHCQN